MFSTIGIKWINGNEAIPSRFEKPKGSANDEARVMARGIQIAWDSNTKGGVMLKSNLLRKIKVIIFFMAIMGSLFATSPLSAADFTFTTILPPGWEWAACRGAINDNGLVAGWGQDETVWKAFTYYNGTYEIIPQDGWDAFYPLKVNNDGIIVGEGQSKGSQDIRAVVYSGGVLTDVTPSGVAQARLVDVNIHGEMIGNICDMGTVGFLYSNGVYTQLVPPGWNSSLVNAINNDGTVIGRNAEDTKQFFYKDGNYTIINTSSEFDGINDNGEVVGMVPIPDDVYNVVKGFIYSKGVFTQPLSPPNWITAYLYDINNSGVAAGYGFDPAVDSEIGFVYDHGTYSIFLPPAFDGVHVLAINNNGVVLGYGWNAQQFSTVFTATPIADVTNPDVTITNKPSNPSANVTAIFEFTSSVTNSTFQCMLDGGIYVDCTSPKTYSDLINGAHAFHVQAKDQSGNTGPDASYQWTIRTPPTGSVLINSGAAYTKSASINLTLSASDGVSQMCISNTSTCASWTAFTATKTWTLPSGNGQKTVGVWFRDKWGNTNSMPYSDSILVDTTVPSDGIVTATPGNEQVTLKWSGFTDTVSGLSGYKIVYAMWVAPTSCSVGTAVPVYDGVSTTYIHTGLTNSTTYFYRVCAIDKAGNMSAGSTRSVKPIPETTPPSGSIVINGGAVATKSTSVTLTLTATDDSGGPIQMCLSNTTNCTLWMTFAASKTWTLTAGSGNRTVNVWFKDKWGNQNTQPYSAAIMLDTTAPANGTVTATPGNEQITLNWLGFSDALSGIGSYKLVFAIGSYAPFNCLSGTTLYTGTDTTFLHTQLANGTTYSYRVCAIDKAGNMSAGATRSAKPIP
jgi:hypothetical protein